MEPYNCAAGILARVVQRRGSARNLCLDARVQQKRVVFKLVHETLRNLKAIDRALRDADVHAQLGGGAAAAASGSASAPNAELARAAARLFAYELLLGQGLHRRPGRSAPEVRSALALVLKRRQQLKAAFAALGPAARSRTPPPKLPRYVRVNTLKATVEQVEAALARVHPSVCRDPHVPALLRLPPGTDVHAHELVASGRAILQDKASCMPVLALRARPGWRCVDACAAPGNKTTQLAAAVGARGRIVAFERDARRAELLSRRVGEAGAHAIVEVRHADFLSARPADHRRVRALLVDPTCSGSGIVGRLGAPDEGESADTNGGDASAPAERIAALAAMQQRVLCHALSFPRATVVVYSTCSVHAAENEGVVAAALGAVAPLGWRLGVALPAWPRRGLPNAGVELSDELCARCVRCLPEDGCGGFFVARFERPAALRAAFTTARRSRLALATRGPLRLQRVLARATATTRWSA
ncbi:hypothetical protein KFE25_008647 [Diacronema lutheri]|uniref:SAM-dependent MTase RsmB/NOP-type domain-containing protein n=1 Tax=Diacronema lutheri TaxID=2081491 RepID=A0A8J6CGL5_DIALT|nr:hypothetical protein KFE25_008647 [Diacronema lutheri]